MKAVEVGLMAAGTLALFINPSGGRLPLIVLGCLGVHSALFGPAKYGILPEILPHDRLSQGNGALELSTFLAILGGTAIGGLLLDGVGTATWLAPLVLTILSLIGFGASLTVPTVPVARTEGGLGSTVAGAVQAVRTNRTLFLAVLGSAFFWTVASLVSQDILVFTKTVLHLSDGLSGLPLAFLSIGIGVGAVDAPPIPARAEDASGLTLCTSTEILRGQEVFLRYGLMEHGTLWGHGAYLGPDYSADTLHEAVQVERDMLARSRYGRAFAALETGAAAEVADAVRRQSERESLRPWNRGPAFHRSRCGSTRCITRPLG